MSATTVRPGRLSRGRLWFGALAAPVAWSLHLLVSYGFVGPACAAGSGALIHLATLALAAASVAGGVVAYRIWRRDGRTDGERFLGGGGLLFSGLFFFAILMAWYPSLVLGPCART